VEEELNLSPNNSRHSSSSSSSQLMSNTTNNNHVNTNVIESDETTAVSEINHENITDSVGIEEENAKTHLTNGSESTKMDRCKFDRTIHL